MNEHTNVRRALVAIAISMCLGVSLGCKNPAEQVRDSATKPERVEPVGEGPETRVGSSEPNEATLFLMADIRGVLRPCGCTLELQKGGFDRLGPYLDAERKAYPNHRVIHAGPLFFGKDQVPENKAAQWERQAEVLGDLVQQVGIDLAGASSIDAVAAKGAYPALVARSKLQMTAANLRVPGLSFPRSRLEKVGNVTFGIIALAAPIDAAGKSGVVVTDPREAMNQALVELDGKADIVVLLSALGLRQTKRLVRRAKDVDFAVVGGLGEHPVVSDEAELVGNTRVVQFHREGRWVGRLTVKLAGDKGDFVDVSAPSEAEKKALDIRITQLTKALKTWSKSRKADDPAVLSATEQLAALKTERDQLAQPVATPSDGKSTFSFRATALPWDLPQDSTILASMTAFDEELKVINLKNAPPLPEPKPGQATFIGVMACLECHDETEYYWNHDRHSVAWETLEKDNKTFDADCVSCHVTGYGEAGGSTIGKTKGLEDVQCESCHGPGSLHAEADDDRLKETIVLSPTQAVCVTCHNKHHSPNFDFTKYRQKLLVPGHGKPLL